MELNTANGTVAADTLGPTLMHEHLICGFPGWEGDTTAPEMDRRDIVEVCVDRIEELKAAGFRSLLDPCPSDLGRDVELYAEVSARTGFNILFATGLYLEQYSSPYWRFKLAFGEVALDELAQMYVTEITEGIGPSKLKPAVIKLAVGTDPDSPYEAKLIAAAARASKATGAPILAHTEAVGGDLLLAKLGALGVPAHKVIVGHSDGSADKLYHRAIVDAGGYIGFDRFGVTAFQDDAVRVECLHSLLEDGFEQQVLVSHDCAFCLRGAMTPAALRPSSPPTGPLHFTREIAPKLRARGVAQAAIDRILTDNPRRFFCEEAPLRPSKAKAPPIAEDLASIAPG